MTGRKNRHGGTPRDAFLGAEGVREAARAEALTRVVAWQLSREMQRQGMTKAALAERMHTSRSHLDRLLDAHDTGLTLETLSKAARALGRSVRVELAGA